MEDSESLSSRPLHHDTLPKIDELSTKEQLKLCCQPRYKIRRVKTKGAILVLIWNFLALFLLGFGNRNYIPNSNNGIIVSVALFGLTLPLAGWLADTCIGRYKMIYCSVWVMWAATILETLNTIIEKLLDGGFASVNAVVTQVLLGLIGIGLGGFLSTVWQFGIDQLHDSSTNEISAFIIWHIWTCGGPLFIMNLTLHYLPFNDQRFILLSYLTLCMNLSLILISLFYCDHWLIKEPILQNPFRLIYRVTMYALKNKHPQCRSAFTYCEDEIVGRIDYGKSKYGGPFTTEQVENVKTFYRVLPRIIVGGILVGELISGDFLDYYLKYQFVLPHYNTELKGVTDDSISMIIPHSISVLIVLHEVLLYPIFHRYCPWVTSLHKLMMGAILQIGMFLSLMIFGLLSRQSYLKKKGYNATVSCVFYHDQVLATNFNYNWIVIPNILFVISILLMAIGGLEFVAAQVPYSMKGVLLGIGYCSVTITATVNYVAVSVGPFQQKLSIWGTKVISCGFWYAFLHVVLCTFGCIVAILIIKWYKRRKREDVLPNEHFYAERYYSNLLEHSHA